MHFGYIYNDLLSKWYNDYKVEDSFDIKNNMIIHSGYNWDDNKQSWKSNGKYETIYDSNNHKIAEISYNLDESTQKWFEVRRKEFYYNWRGKELIPADEYGLNFETKRFIRTTKVIFVNDTITNSLTVSTYYGTQDTNKWELYREEKSMFNNNNKLICKSIKVNDSDLDEEEKWIKTYFY